MTPGRPGGERSTTPAGARASRALIAQRPAAGGVQ